MRTKIRCDQLYRTLRDSGMNVKALHGDMTQGSRDGVMLAFKAGRLPVLVATDVAARGLDITSVTHVINYDVPVSPDVYVHRIGRTGRVGRSGRAITFVEARQKRELEAIERHIKTSIEPWSKGAHTAPARVEEKPRRHSKPHVSRNGEGPWAKLVASGGRASGVRVADLVSAVTRATGLDGEAVRDVKLLERFALLSVPESEADRVIGALDGRAGRRSAAEAGAGEDAAVWAPARASVGARPSAGAPLPREQETVMSTATMNTTEGAITFELFDEDAPKTVENFRKLAGDGFYDGLTFHRVIIRTS